MKDRLPDRSIALPMLVVGPTAFLSISDSLYHNVHSWILTGSHIGNALLPFGSPLILTLLSATAVWYAAPLGRTGWLSLAVGYAFAWFVLFNFRGPLYWHGLFDLADRDPWPAYAWIPASVILGLALSRISMNGVSRHFMTKAYIFVGVLALAYIWIQFLCRDDIYSAFPMVRHLVLTTLYLVVVAAAVSITRWFPELWEES